MLSLVYGQPICHLITKSIFVVYISPKSTNYTQYYKQLIYKVDHISPNCSYAEISIPCDLFT